MKKKGLCLFIGFTFLSSLLFAQSNTDSLCGIKSILVIYRHFGITPELKETGNLIRKYPNEMSMYQVSRVLERKGLYTKGVKISLEELKSTKIPAILYIYPNHFVVFKEYKNKKFEIIDLPKKYVLTEKQLSTSYSGFALLVSRDKKQFPEIKRQSSDIRFDRYAYNFGKVKSGKKINCTFRFRNNGTNPLVIKNVRAGCGCVISEVSKKFLLPGEKGEIKITLDTSGREGIQKQFIYIHSNDPITPIFLLRLEGIISTPFRYYPYLVDFGQVRIGEVVKRELFLLSGEGEKINIRKIIAPNNLEIKTESIKEGYKITLIFKPEKITSINDKVLIRTSIWGNRKVEIPVEANVKGETECFPEFIFFGIVKRGTQPITSIKIYNYYGKNFKITEISKDIDWISVNLKNSEKSKQYKLTAKLKTEKLKQGISKGEIKIKTNIPSEPILKIPVYTWLKN